MLRLVLNRLPPLTLNTTVDLWRHSLGMVVYAGSARSRCRACHLENDQAWRRPTGVVLFYLFKCSVALCLLLVTCLFPRGDNTAMTTLVNYKRMIFGEIGKLKVDLHLVCSSNHGGAYCKLWRSSWKDVGAATPRANVIRGCDSGVKMAPHVVFLTALSQNFLR